MDKMLYVAMTGASQNTLAQRAHANNLANISTSGFRRDFEQARSMPVFGESLPARAYAMSERPGTDFTPGSLQETGRDLDVAVEGQGWIAVQAADGSEAYVRTASLQIDAARSVAHQCRSCRCWAMADRLPCRRRRRSKSARTAR